MLTPFIHGFLLTLGLIIPLGPQNMFVLNEAGNFKNLRQTMLIATILATGDTILLLLAVFGATEVVIQIPHIKYSLMACGVLFLSYTGYVSFCKSRNVNDFPTKASTSSFKKKLSYAVTISLFNPQSITDAVSVIGTNALLYQGSGRVWFTVAAVINSWIWFFFISIVGKRLSKFTTLKRRINLISSFIMWGCALTLVDTIFDEIVNT